MANFDVLILGGGPAGYVCAIRSAQLGLTVGVIEREALGGTCVLWGCIPAKALLESAGLAQKLKAAAEHGIGLGEITLDYGAAMKRSRAVSSQNSKGVEFLFKKNKVTQIKGEGRITSPKTVVVKKGDGTEETHTAT
ncbi:MAG: FAD-dependent oxidoreductase, partial [Gemmatimonadaceae bacterium]|nr:FAD-dependent oxidoreductase [Gemmatimonadaceae bacterium]